MAGGRLMKKSVVMQIIVVVIFGILAAVDIIAFYIPIAAIVVIALVLFRPKWLLRFFHKLYEVDLPDTENHSSIWKS
jgi:hypothetical protein